jgi:TonB family protein
MSSISHVVILCCLVCGCATEPYPGYSSTYQIGKSDAVISKNADAVFAERVATETRLPSGQPLDEPLKLLVSVLPRMPPQAIEQKLEGTVTVRITFDEPGNVDSISVLSSPHELLTLAVLTAMRQWKLSPRLKDGKPIKTVARQSFTFVAK